MKEILSPMLRRDIPSEQVESGQLRIFNNYLRNLGITEEDLKNKKILDVGGNSGSFGDVATRFGAQVVSVDSVRPKDWKDVIDGPSKKLFEISAENLNIKDRLGLKEEPEFDFVFSHFSTPYVLVNEGQNKDGNWKDDMSSEDRFGLLYEKTAQSLHNIFLHLKNGGQAIVYPLFLNLDNHEAMAVDFTHGEKRDVREFNLVVHSVLNDLLTSYKDRFEIRMDEVPQKNGINLTRLVATRKK